MAKTHRFELTILILGCLAAGVAAGWVIDRLGATVPAGECWAMIDAALTNADLDRCPGLMEFASLRADLGNWVLLVLAVLPVVAAITLGVGAVGREIEFRTAVLAWSVDAARRHWLMERISVGAAVVGIAGLLAAVVATLLVTQQNPGLDIWSSFVAYGLWGPLVAVRGLVVFTVAVLIGALVGRVLPSILLTIAAAAAIWLTLPALAPIGYPTTVIPDIGGGRDPGTRYLEDALVDDRGQILTFAEAREMAPAELDAGDMSDWVYTNFEPVSVVIAGKEMPGVAFRELVLMSTVALVAIVGSLVVVRRRRPY